MVRKRRNGKNKINKNEKSKSNVGHLDRMKGHGSKYKIEKEVENGK